MSSENLIKERVDPRIKRTRRLILQAFSDSLAEKSFQSISVQDITERAGINRTTFYLHFPDKFALLDTSINQMFQGELEKRTLNTCQFSHENLRSLIITVAEFIAHSNAHCAHADQQFETLVETRVKQQVFDLLQMWGEKVGRSPEDSRTAAVAASWAIYGLALEWSHDRQPPPVEDLAGRIAPLMYAILGFEQPEIETVPGGQMSIEEIGCCGAYCGTCPVMKQDLCRGCKLGYLSGERDINKAKCKMKVCCIKRGYQTCADCEEYESCAILQEFFNKNGYKYRKYHQALDYIRANGYARFLAVADGWKIQYGKYDDSAGIEP